MLVFFRRSQEEEEEEVKKNTTRDNNNNNIIMGRNRRHTRNAPRTREEDKERERERAKKVVLFAVYEPLCYYFSLFNYTRALYFSLKFAFTFASSIFFFVERVRTIEPLIFSVLHVAFAQQREPGFLVERNHVFFAQQPNRFQL